MEHYLSSLFRDNANLIRRRKQIGMAVKTGGANVATLRVSGNGRYIVDRRGPIIVIRDDGQGMITNLTLNEADTYLSNRHSKGINLLETFILNGDGGGGRADLTTVDSIAPFTVSGDITTPNSTYFARVDAMINLASQYQITLCLNAASTYDTETLAIFTDATEAQCTTYGEFLGNRYKNFPNIVWTYGCDYSTTSEAVDVKIKAVCTGIRNADKNHIHTIWLDTYRIVRSLADWEPLVDFDFIYTYVSPYDYCLTSYGTAPAMPVLHQESNYEGESHGGYLTTDLHIRKQNYWSLLSGARGVGYGHSVVWYFGSGWGDLLNTDGVNQISYLVSLFQAYNWWNLVPDNAHDVLTVGYGTYDANGSIDTNDYAACSWIADGSLAMIYMPTNRTMTVDMSKFSGTVTCRWFDPTDGSYAADAASPHANSGTHDFSHAGANSAGAADWVLVLEA